MIKTITRSSILLAAAILVGGGCASIIVSAGLTPKNTERIRDSKFKSNRELWEKLTPGITAWTDSLKAIGVLRDTFIFYGSVRMHACYMAADCRGASGKTALIVHGYVSSPYNVMPLARMYRDSIGYNVLLPTLRHHGYSGGEAIQMGWLDRLDLLRWSETAHRIFGDTLQVLHGVSMGAATVMMASGEETPRYVRGFVEDCGYTSVWNELNYAMDKYAHLKAGPTAYRAERIVSRKFGWDFHEASSVRQLGKCTKPFLFIHGEKDPLVPARMAEYNYNAKSQGYRELWIAPGSVHARSFPDHPQEYLSRVRAFLKNHVERSAAAVRETD